MLGCIIVLIIIINPLLFRARVMMINRKAIFTILFIRSGLTLKFKRRVEGYRRTERAPSYARKMAYQAAKRRTILIQVILL